MHQSTTIVIISQKKKTLHTSGLFNWQFLLYSKIFIVKVHAVFKKIHSSKKIIQKIGIQHEKTVTTKQEHICSTHVTFVMEVCNCAECCCLCVCSRTYTSHINIQLLIWLPWIHLAQRGNVDNTDFLQGCDMGFIVALPHVSDGSFRASSFVAQSELPWHGRWPSQEAWSAQALHIFLVKLVIKVGAACLLALRLTVWHGSM